MKATIGISQCLIGDEVRYDGTHQRIPFVTELLATYCQLIPLCPEIAIGMTVPRPPIELVVETDGVRALGVQNRAVDVTAPLSNLVDEWSASIGKMDGFIFTHKSPSCGVGSVKRVTYDGEIIDRQGSGIFAGEVMRRYPLLPVIEAMDLSDTEKRHIFLSKVFALSDFRSTVLYSLSKASLIQFYSRYKYQVMACSPVAYKALGQKVASANRDNLIVEANDFLTLLLETLGMPFHPGRYNNALQHMFGYFKSQLSPHEKQQVLDCLYVEDSSFDRLQNAVNLLKEISNRFDNVYISSQSLLRPYPSELACK